MRGSLKFIVLACTLLVGSAASAYSQSPSENLKAKVDAVIAKAYESAAAKFPCRVKARGKAKMLRWQDVEKCLNSANDRVDWEDLSQQLQKMRESEGFRAVDISSAVESSLSAYAIPYNKVFLVKEMEALLPLSNSVLKFLPVDSLMDLPVYNKSAERIGLFSGIYSFEKVGEISGTRNRYTLFQYTDTKGNIQPSPERLLLDSFGVPWKGVISQPGFRLPSDRLVPRH
jgi:hypothetical protein